MQVCSRLSSSMARASHARHQLRHMSNVAAKEQPKSSRHPVKKLLVGTLLAGGAAVYAFDKQEEVARSMYFYCHAVPPFLHYRYTQFVHGDKPEVSSMYEVLHEKYKDVPLRTILHLGGFYTKFGQIVSGLDGSVVPKTYVESLKVLQEDMPPRPTKEIIEILESELGCPIEDVFSEFDQKALGAASIGQVHAAKLLDGTDVVVKIQYPDTERYFRMDIATLKSFCKIAQPEQIPLFDEIEKQFMTEFDYRLEGEQLVTAAHNVQEHFPGVVIPEPIRKGHKSSPLPGGLCTKKVLVMERLHGKSLQKSQREYLHKMAQDQGKTVSELEVELREEILNTPTDQVKVHSETEIKLYRNYLYAQDLVRNTTAFLYNWTLGFVGSPISYEWQPAPINSHQLLETVYKVHGHQLFFDGFFNGDPHPGNIMLLDDGRIGLIDYGQVKRMAVEDRIKLAKLYLALARDDDEAIIQRWKDCGFETKENKPNVIRASAYFNFDRWTDDIVDEFGGFALFQETLNAADNCVTLPQEYIMAFRLSALMRINAMGLGHVSGRFSQVAKVWEEQAREFLVSQGVEVDGL